MTIDPAVNLIDGRLARNKLGRHVNQTPGCFGQI